MWKFRKMMKGEDSVDPIQGEFFSSEEIGDLSEVLIRESIQNSLDARIDKENKVAEVFISYGFSEYSFSDLKEEGMPLYGLDSHISAENSGLNLNKIPKPDEKVDYLVVEDFGTRGLNGDQNYNDNNSPVPIDDHKLYDFFFFWRNIGRSGKKDGLGSWGLGKQVFPAASRINSYFGLTCRSEDNQKLLMGKSILKIHHHNKKKYAPYGYYGQFDDEDFFALPFIEEDHINSFTEIFKLQRNSEHGLSVIIPFPKPELGSPNPLAISVLKDYFYPIIQGRLKVVIKYKDCEEIVIDHTTIKVVAKKYITNDEILLKTIDLAIWSIRLVDEDIIRFASPDLHKKPSVANIEISEEILRKIRSSLEEKGKVALRVPVRVSSKKTSSKEGFFDICFAQTDSLNRVPVKYLRQGIDIKNAVKRSKLDIGCIALLEVNDNVLGRLLRISEPPAHDRWDPRNNGDLLEQYEYGAATIKFVKNAPHEIWKRISQKDIKQDKDLLRDLFYLDISSIPLPPEPTPNIIGPPSPNRIIDPPPPLPPIKQSVRMIRTEKITGEISGFVVSPAENATHIPNTIQIKVAYRVGVGNQFKKYSPLDFQLNKFPIQIKMEGLEKEICNKNVLFLKVIHERFKLKVVGFDPHRDLVVQVIPIKKEDDDD